MRNATVGTLDRSEDRTDNFRALVSDLQSLLSHVQANIDQLELTVAAEKAPAHTSANVVELDDVTPRYLKVSTALNACKADLGAALDSLLDDGQPYGQRAGGRVQPAPLRLASPI